MSEQPSHVAAATESNEVKPEIEDQGNEDSRKKKFEQIRDYLTIGIVVVSLLSGLIYASILYAEYDERPEYKIMLRKDMLGEQTVTPEEEQQEDESGYIISVGSTSVDDDCQLFDDPEGALSLTQGVHDYYIWWFWLWFFGRIPLGAVLIYFKILSLQGKPVTRKVRQISVVSAVVTFRTLFEFSLISQTYPILLYEWHENCFGAPEVLVDDFMRTSLVLSFILLWILPFTWRYVWIPFACIAAPFVLMDGDEEDGKIPGCGFVGIILAGIAALLVIIMVVGAIVTSVVLYLALNLFPYLLFGCEVIIILSNLPAFLEVLCYRFKNWRCKKTSEEKQLLTGPDRGAPAQTLSTIREAGD